MRIVAGLKVGTFGEEKRLAKTSPTRKDGVWATQIRLRIYRPGHPAWT
jgi:hypothetical protein